MQARRLSHDKTELDPILHQPIRTKIVAHLAYQGKSAFVSLRSSLSLSDGHMSTHMRLLIAEGYVAAKKELVDDKAQTVYALTAQGKKAFTKYFPFATNQYLHPAPI